mmetsp:Transcript_113088/g.330544  ORF Transcript_113088/g.330544 Transcript_113088/m.330544 type:complete len:384 (+) Transcript_113088:318-1469(+)
MRCGFAGARSSSVVEILLPPATENERVRVLPGWLQSSGDVVILLPTLARAGACGDMELVSSLEPPIVEVFCGDASELALSWHTDMMRLQPPGSFIRALAAAPAPSLSSMCSSVSDVSVPSPLAPFGEAASSGVPELADDPPSAFSPCSAPAPFGWNRFHMVTASTTARSRLCLTTTASSPGGAPSAASPAAEPAPAAPPCPRAANSWKRPSASRLLRPLLLSSSSCSLCESSSLSISSRNSMLLRASFTAPGHLASGRPSAGCRLLPAFASSSEMFASSSPFPASTALLASSTLSMVSFTNSSRLEFCPDMLDPRGSRASLHWPGTCCCCHSSTAFAGLPRSLAMLGKWSLALALPASTVSATLMSLRAFIFSLESRPRHFSA